jgi:hypothetical protein
VRPPAPPIILFASLSFGSLLMVILVPSLYRLFIDYPSRLLWRLIQ